MSCQVRTFVDHGERALTREIACHGLTILLMERDGGICCGPPQHMHELPSHVAEHLIDRRGPYGPDADGFHLDMCVEDGMETLWIQTPVDFFIVHEPMIEQFLHDLRCLHEGTEWSRWSLTEDTELTRTLHAPADGPSLHERLHAPRS